MTSIQIIAPGLFATIQDLGRNGFGDLGVSPSGAADVGAHCLANRLVGNPESAATIEITDGGLVIEPDRPITVAVTGAMTVVSLDGTRQAVDQSIRVPAGLRLHIASPVVGLRNHLAVRGGIDVPLVMGSRSTDVLSGIGPPPLAAGDILPVGSALDAIPPIDTAPVRHEQLRRFDVMLGPRASDLTDDARHHMVHGGYRVAAQSNRVGLVLHGPMLEHREDAPTRPSEGVVRGALQAPRMGVPILFLADHPVTGGYPIVAVVRAHHLDALAQLDTLDEFTLRLT